MHEHHAVEALVKQVVENAANAKAVKVTKVYIVLGELAGFAEESIQLYFDEISKGTVAEGAALSFKHQAPKLHCKKCNTIFEKRKSEFTCPNCCALGFLTNSGKEFYVESIDIE